MPKLTTLSLRKKPRKQHITCDLGSFPVLSILFRDVVECGQNSPRHSFPWPFRIRTSHDLFQNMHIRSMPFQFLDKFNLHMIHMPHEINMFLSHSSWHADFHSIIQTISILKTSMKITCPSHDLRFFKSDLGSFFGSRSRSIFLGLVSPWETQCPLLWWPSKAPALAT